MITIKQIFEASDSQIEVWEWKHALYDEIKDLDKNARLSYIIDKASKTKRLLIERKERKKNLATI